MIGFTNPLVLLFLLIIPVFLVLQLRRSNRSNRMTVSTVIRSALFAVLIIVISGPQTGLRTKGTNIMFVVDRSHSTTTGDTGVDEFIRGVSSNMTPDDRAGVVTFGSDSAVEQPLAEDFLHETFESIIDADGTDIEAAILRGLSLLSTDKQSRIFLLSDGVETRGSAENAAAVAARMGVPIDVVPIVSSRIDADASIIGIDTPNSVNAGQVFDMSIFLSASEPVNAWLYMIRDGEFLGEDYLELSAGENTLTYTSLATDAGEHRYQVFLEPQVDSVLENNVYDVSIRVLGAPAILYAAKPGERSNALISALTTQGISVHPIETGEFPNDLTGLLKYDAIIFDNVPAFDLSFARMELIERYVRDLGGGFLMLGGDTSFGLGGYYNTPVERLLPVDMDVTSSMNIPSLALVMVVDKSGSMGDTIASGETKLDLVKEAVIASVEVLNPFYTVGLLSFDADIEWTIPPVRAGDREEIVGRLSGLASGGGTMLFPAMQAAFSELEKTEAAVKHMLVLSDGLTDDGDFEGLVEEITSERITISTIAVGSDSDRDLLEMIADRGGGRGYFTDDIERVPRIFASESIIVSRGLIVEETFFPQPEDPSDITEGIDLYSIPPMEGFVLSYTKPSATQILTTFNGNPLLAAWQYGLGRSVAFTSDMKGRWGKALVDWEEFPKFAGQLVRWIQRPPESETLDIDFSIEKSVGLLTVDAVDESGNFLNGRGVRAVILYPDGSTDITDLIQTAPGRYEADFAATETGEYYVSVYDAATTGDQDLAWSPVSASYSVPYSPEYLPREPDTDLLRRIADISGGKIISTRDTDVELASTATGRSMSPLWRLFLVAAVILFLVDVAYRQIARSPDDQEASPLRGLFKRERSQRRPGYREVIERIEQGFQDDRSRKRELGYWFGQDIEKREAEKRLYLAKRKRP